MENLTRGHKTRNYPLLNRHGEFENPSFENLVKPIKYHYNLIKIYCKGRGIKFPTNPKISYLTHQTFRVYRNIPRWFMVFAKYYCRARGVIAKKQTIVGDNNLIIKSIRIIGNATYVKQVVMELHDLYESMKTFKRRIRSQHYARIRYWRNKRTHITTYRSYKTAMVNEKPNVYAYKRFIRTIETLIEKMIHGCNLGYKRPWEVEILKLYNNGKIK